MTAVVTLTGAPTCGAVDWNAIDWRKARHKLGYQPAYDFDTYLAKTVHWYQKNKAWWQRVKSGAYQDFYKKWYRRK